jgi:hypothetical protein
MVYEKLVRDVNCVCLELVYRRGLPAATNELSLLTRIKILGRCTKC